MVEDGVRRGVDRTFRILALDGGGMRGLFTAACLAELERVLHVHIIDIVDLFVGTSTGGLIALGVASGHSPSDMVAFYLDCGGRIFGEPRGKVSQLFRPKYDRSRLDAELRELFGESKMNDLLKPVCITAHELIAGNTRVWKDDHAPGLSGGGEQLVWKVAAATSAAPTIFAPVQLGTEDSHVDGGVWANNPAIVGITDAVRYFGRELRDLRLLSIGTTSKVLRIKNHMSACRMGRLAWARRTLSLLQGTVSLGSHWQAALLLPNGQYLRIDSELTEKIRLDDVEEARPLQERGRQAARLNSERARAVFALPSIDSRGPGGDMHK